VFSLSKTLPGITEEQKQWAFKNMLLHIGYRTKTAISCLDCGHVWAGPQLVKTCICPGCGTKLTVNDTRKKKLYQKKRYLSFLDVKDEFQVVRIYEIFSNHKSGEKVRLHIWEVIQQYIIPNGKFTVVARNRNLNGYCDSFHGNMEIRINTDRWCNDKYDLWADRMFPKFKVLPIYMRNGFICKVDDISAYQVFKKILADPKAETLLKAKQFDLLGCRVGNKQYEVEKYWDSIKMCFRNKYMVRDAITWLDYLDLLRFFKKDLYNPKYVCPADLKLEHDKLVAKKTEIDAKERYTNWLKGMGVDIDPLKNLSARQLKEEYDRLTFIKRLVEFGRDKNTLENLTAAQLEVLYDEALLAQNEERRKKEEDRKRQEFEKENKAFEKSKAMYFGIVLSSKDLTVKVLESIQEFIDEGALLTHCVATNKYYTKEDSLILSARVNGQPVETIEIDLKKMKLIQARGFKNLPSKYHDQVVELVNKNMRLIKNRAKTVAGTKEIAA
jgi:hypothetical protein